MRERAVIGALQAQHALSVRRGAIISNFGVMAVSTGLADGISPGGSQGRLVTFGTIGSWRLHPPAGTRWLAVCGVRLGWLRSEEAKAKHSTAKQNKARAVDLSGRRDCREHVCIRTRTSDQWVREHACLRSLRSLMLSSTSHKSQAFRPASRRDAVKTRWQMR